MRAIRARSDIDSIDKNQDNIITYKKNDLIVTPNGISYTYGDYDMETTINENLVSSTDSSVGFGSVAYITPYEKGANGKLILNGDEEIMTFRSRMQFDDISPDKDKDKDEEEADIQARIDGGGLTEEEAKSFLKAYGRGRGRGRGRLHRVLEFHFIEFLKKTKFFSNYIKLDWLKTTKELRIEDYEQELDKTQIDFVSSEEVVDVISKVELDEERKICRYK